MTGQAFATQATFRPVSHFGSSVPRWGHCRMDRDSISALQRIDIFNAVWSGALLTTLLPGETGRTGQSSVHIVNGLKDPMFGTIESVELLSAMNIEQARTLFLCNLSLVQEKLRDLKVQDQPARFGIAVDAEALAMLGGELRIIAQHTPHLFARLQVTALMNENATLSSVQHDQLTALEALGLTIDMRRVLSDRPA
ncbi:hypothetical protein [Oryzifoliimicrobium ureilyticus]|uniref:hypothetical protein n=1 Tax=Oryzifoliimicrobium ureilyticus TaxID=3113724 RepID=UPI003076093E